MYATIGNRSSSASGLIYFGVKAFQRIYIRLGRNTTKWFWTEEWVQWYSNIWARVEGKAIPPGSKATYSFTVSGKYPEQGGNPFVAISVSDTEPLQYDTTC